MAEKEEQDAPRIYNMFPRLIGSIENWYSHLDRIVDMNFNWIYFNPLSLPGFSGSLYSIKDYYKFNPLFAPSDAEDPTSWDPFKDFINAAHNKGVKIMYDLVINHTAVDSPLIDEHPEWYLQKYAIINKQNNYAVKFFSLDETTTIYEEEFPSAEYYIEKRIASPYAIDPADATKITIWGDLAEINNMNSPDLENLEKYWLNLLDFYHNLGLDGYRCDAAYKIPACMWNLLISHARKLNPYVLFMAETLGCTLPELERTMEADFDYINNSSKWWDYTSDWCLKQYNQFRKFAPSVGFPESHDTERLAAETDGRKDIQIFRYFFSSFFSAGVLVPLGYEFGFKKKVNVVDMKVEDYEEPSFDISEDINTINKFKRSIRCLNEDGAMIHYNKYKDPNVLILKKSSVDGKQQLLLIYNKDWNNPHNIDIYFLREYLTLRKTIYQIKLNRAASIYSNDSFIRRLEPNEFVLFLQE
ncbi:MAG: alpha-amylase [Candidatus Lokiarchaeota archaeon]|nr:alpha-amylase [Candidatus Lokiarchaeota archaeon]